jgi:two-component system NtrC family sensor kinase
MPAALRLKLVGEGPEIDKIENSVREAAISYQRYAEIESACESQELEPAEIFLLSPSLYFQSHLGQIAKLARPPEILLASEKKLPNLAKILVPHPVYTDWSPSEMAWQIQKAAEFHRRKRRLDALRDHHKRSWNLESNPAINLVTNLMRKCTMAEEYQDLLTAVLTLRAVIDFHDCCLITLDAEQNLLEGWLCPKESKERFEKIELHNAEPAVLKALAEGTSHLFTSAEADKWDSFTKHPWSFAMPFAVHDIPRRSKAAKSAVLILFRRELVPFVERDIWLLELTYGPLALALEKIAMLKSIVQASKEWRTTFDGISEPLTVIDSTYQIVKANKAFASLVDHDYKKLKGRRCYSLLANRRTPCVGCPVGMGTQPQGGSRVQLQGKVRKDLLVWSYGIRTGLDSYQFQFYRNVSKETALASTLIQSEKMAALGRLVGAVAHELNNPLAGILATSQILLQEGKADGIDAATMEDIEEIRSAAWRSKKIIDDLLGFTSTEEQALVETNLLDAVRSALTFSKAALKEVAVKVHSEKVVPRGIASPTALQQVLFNLITNAAQAMNSKGSIEITIKCEGDFYRIDVRDSGPGIPAEKLKNIFEPFFTSKQEGTGTGLGLSIVRHLTQKMNARLEVTSSASKGTCFSVFVPLAKPNEVLQ